MARVLLTLGLVVCLTTLGMCMQNEVASAKNWQKIYREQLKAVQTGYGGAYSLPAQEFFLFGMGNRKKYLFQNKALKDAVTGQTIRQWPNATEVVVNVSQYLVLVKLPNQQVVRIVENVNGIYMEENGNQVPLADADIKIPNFSGHKYAQVLRVLFQEVMVNIQDGQPMGNFLTNKRPSYRQAAIIAMVLQKTDNLEVIRPWISRISEPFDGLANKPEPDNLGQVLFLASLGANRKHPVIDKVKEVLPKHVKGKQLQGLTDYAEHPVYQTRWLKFGMRAVKLDTKEYVVPETADFYATQTWWDTEDLQKDKRTNITDDKHPALIWGEDHLTNNKRGKISNRDYPLTWDVEGLHCDHSAMKTIGEEYVKGKIAAPHAFHAAEAFLLLLGDK